LNIQASQHLPFDARIPGSFGMVLSPDANVKRALRAFHLIPVPAHG
jgi:hypothetical protein